ncbi:MAG: recombination mediator RecR [Candidatus Nealsonbacteria bacterium]
MYPKSIQKLIDIFSKFPTVGPRTAARFVFYLIKKPEKEINDLIKSISNLKESVKICSFCFNSFEIGTREISPPAEAATVLCPICQDASRDRTLVCVIEKETDLISIEKIKKYKGLYFILGGMVSKLRKEDIKKATLQGVSHFVPYRRIKELEERIKNPRTFGLPKTDFKEIIIAINPTEEGEATALYLERFLKPLNKKITRLGRGLPVGGELEYADEETLSSALESRR